MNYCWSVKHRGCLPEFVGSNPTSSNRDFAPKIKKRGDFLDWIIKNHKNVYIKLNENGSPVTCSEDDKTLFNKVKAENVLGSLPKTLRRLKFRVECIPDIPLKEKVIQGGKYEVSEDIKKWIDKFGTCGDILNEAIERKNMLRKELEDVDNEFLDIVHRVEIETDKDMYRGWLEYKHIKKNREKRRLIKDELLIINNV